MEQQSNYIIEVKRCRKCNCVLGENSTSDGFCDRQCKCEYSRDNRKSNEEIFEGVMGTYKGDR